MSANPYRAKRELSQKKRLVVRALRRQTEAFRTGRLRGLAEHPTLSTRPSARTR